MSVLIWNARGLGSGSAMDYLKEIIRMNRPEIIGILEPKQRVESIQRYAQEIGYPGYTHGEPYNSHIWIFWQPAV